MPLDDRHERSLFRYAALRHPEHAQLIQQVLAIPQKRFDRAPVSFLISAETDALLAAPDPGRWEGRRDRALLTLAAQTGLRLSELTGLTCADAQLTAPAHVRCTGKGPQAASSFGVEAGEVVAARVFQIATRIACWMATLGFCGPRRVAMRRYFAFR